MSEASFQERYEVLTTLHHFNEWHNDDGPVLWWVRDDPGRDSISEPPTYIGSPLDSDWIDCVRVMFEDDDELEQWMLWSRLPTTLRFPSERRNQEEV